MPVSVTFPLLVYNIQQLKEEVYFGSQFQPIVGWLQGRKGVIKSRRQRKVPPSMANRKMGKKEVAREVDKSFRVMAPVTHL